MSTTGRVGWGSRTRSGWVIGRVGGAPLVLAPSWLLVAAFLTILFVPTVRAVAPGLGAAATVAAAAGFPVLLAVSVVLHELGHGLTARRLGIPVTEYVITLWGGHTQFERDLPGPGASAVVSVAGPLANGVLGLACWWLAGLGDGLGSVLLSAAALANAFVAGFNMLPGLPLDGGRVLEALVWWLTGDRSRGTILAGWVGRVIAIGSVVLAVGVPVFQGRQVGMVTAVTVALLAAFLWSGAGQAIRSAGFARRTGEIDLLALATPALAVPMSANVARLDAVPPGVAVVVVAEDGAPVAVVDPAAAAAVPAPLRGATGVGAVARAVPPECIVTARLGPAAVRAAGLARRHAPFVVLVEPSAPQRVLGLVPLDAVARAMSGAWPP